MLLFPLQSVRGWGMGGLKKMVEKKKIGKALDCGLHQNQACTRPYLTWAFILVKLAAWGFTLDLENLGKKKEALG